MLKQILISAPDSQFEASFKAAVELWDESPTALQILELLDKCALTAGGSGFVISLLQHSLENAMLAEGVMLEDLVKQAVWRTEWI